MSAATLTAEQRELRDRVIAAGRPAADTFRVERRDGVLARDIAAVADDLCPGAGKDWR